MPVESATDLGVFFDTRDFGVTATFHRGAARYTVAGIFDREYAAADVAEVEFASTEPMFTMQSSELPDGAVPGDLLAIGSTQFIVRNIEPDGTGVTRLRLESPT